MSYQQNKFNRPARPELGADEMVFGVQSVLETLRSDQQIDKLYMEKGMSNPDIQQLAFQNRVTIQRVPVEKLDRFTRKNHQGVVCLVAAVQYVKLSNVIADVNERGEVPFVLLLDRITDVRNFGAIARTAECTGIQCIVIPGRGAAAPAGSPSRPRRRHHACRGAAAACAAALRRRADGYRHDLAGLYALVRTPP